jgi:hypothetical protein
VEDIIEDLPVVVAAEPTPDVQQVEVIDHVATDPYESSNYTCVFPATNMTYRAADTSPPWMSSMLYYVVENLDSAGESLHTDNRFPLWEGERPTWSWYASYDTSKEDGTLGESYCVRITTVRMDDASSAMIESCVDAAAFDDLLEEGEVLCTEDNLASHRIPAETHDESTDDDATSSTGCGAAPMALSPWLVGLYLIARRRERVTGVRRRG